MSATLLREYIELLEASQYDNMFSDLLNPPESKTSYVQSLKPIIDNNIKTAKAALKKNDRIIWYLRWFRLGLIKKYYPDNFEEAISRYGRKINQQLNPNESYFQLEYLLHNVANSLNHFLSMNIDKINEHHWGKETPSELLHIFSQYEDEWKEQKGEEEQYIEENDEWDVVVGFPDGSAWINLNVQTCELEADAMGHCGNAGSMDRGDTILSYRSPKNVGGKSMWKPHLTFILDKNGYLGEMKGRGNDKPVENYHKVIVPLLKHSIVKGIKGGGYLPENNFDLRDLSDNVRASLIEGKPSLGTLKQMFKRLGKTKEVTDRIMIMIEAWQLPFIRYAEKSEMFVVEQWKNINALIAEQGNDVAKYVINLASGDEYYETSMEHNEESSKEFFKDLPTDVITKVGEYLKRSYPDIAFDIDDEDEVFDAILEADQIYGDNEIYMMIGWSMDDGIRTGTEAEMIKSLERAIKDINLGEIVFENKENTFMFDTSVVYAFSFVDIIDVLDDYKTLEQIDFEGNWSAMNDIIELDEPHYGWEGYDNAVAKERFEEQINQKIAEQS